MRIRDVLFAMLVMASGCADRTVARVVPQPGKVETKDLPAVSEKDVDILFLIDNSGSMLAEQQSLQQNFPKFMQVLETIEGGAPNMHIGVATSDMGQKASDGVGTASVQGCASSGDDGAMRTTPSVSGRFIVDEQSGSTRNRNYSGTLGDAFAALAGVGTSGCGIEQHLAGVERALQNPLNTGFLRPQAKLAVIVIGDEDDCSLAHNKLFENNVDGAVLNFRCTKSGIVCHDNPDLSKPGVRTDCEPQDESQYLEPVDRYVDFIKGLKPTWRDDVIVAGIIGDTNPFEIVLNASGQPVLGPSCTYGGSQTAFPAVRTTDFLDQFEGKVQKTICGADLSAAMVDIAARLKRSWGDPCWEGQVADLDPAPGLQPDCTVSDVRVLSGGETRELGAIPSCALNGGQVPCWRLAEDTTQCFYTANHLKLVIDRGGVVPPADVHVKASCVTTDPDSGPYM